MATPTPEPAASSDQTAVRSVAQDILRGMTLEQKVGQVFMLGFEGTSLDEGNRALVHDLHLGGVTLFARNVESPAQLAQLTVGLQSIADPVPLFVSIDQEGGLVVRVTEGATIFPGNMALGATGDPALARRVAEATASELRAMGVNMDLAPVVDVNTNPLNPVIGVRSFGSDPQAVGTLGAATIQGLQGGGVSAVAKHFPGHGDTDVDSHLDLPVVPHPLDRLETTELPPFRAAIAAGVDGVMTAHLYVPTLEPRIDVPATLSHAILTGLLREKLGYQDLILTDALDMGAIKRDRGAAEAAVEAVEAGADMLLIAGITEEDRARLAEGPRALLAAVRSGRVPESRLDESVLRVLAAKARRGLIPASGPTSQPQGPGSPGLAVVGNPEHRALALEVARRGITLVRDEAGALPLRPSQHILVISPEHPTRSRVEEDGAAGSLAAAVRRLVPSAEELPVEMAPSPATMARAVERARAVDVVVLATYDLAQQPSQVALAEALKETGRPIVAVALRGPYDAAALPGIRTFLAAYGDRPVHLRAVADALFGELMPTGRVP